MYQQQNFHNNTEEVDLSTMISTLKVYNNE